MPPIKVLIVDDAVVVRRILRDVLSADSDIEVVGTAANGKLAIPKIEQLKPDLVTLDVEMPDLDGLGTLLEIRKHHPKLPVIMFSTLTARGATATLDALAAGASDYVAKPANVGSVTDAKNRIRDELVPKIKSLCKRNHSLTSVSHVASKSLANKPIILPATEPVELLVIGVSTGGPNALAEVIPNLPKDLQVPVVIVQHMPPVFTKYLAERLNAHSALRVVEASEGDRIHPGGVWIAPGNFHLEISGRVGDWHARLHQGPAENFCRPAVDVLFRSAAQHAGPRVLAVVLTGMGQDGLLGSQEIVNQGGQVIAQDEATSVVWGMPGFVVRAGLASKILPISSIAQEISSRVASRRSASGRPAHFVS